MRDACQSRARWCADCFRVSAPTVRSTSTSPAPSAIPRQSHFPDEARKRRLKRRFSIAPCFCLVQKFFSFIACCLVYNLPVADSAPFFIKVDAHFHDGKSAHGKSGRVVLEVNLLHGSSYRLVYFQFKEIQCLVRAHHHVHTASGCAHLHVNVFILCQ